ncbi:rhamnan synthesis F family protein [Rhizobium sp. RCC_161_2]|uniref:rhamnosyltransferase WsaF family glycosyltransferase n=1 Tax=Rhizobium sp. RCC_161_2 TaxID=3239219 RepID=UPI0035266CA3
MTLFANKDARWQASLIKNSPFFDKNFYAKSIRGEIKGDYAAHYIRSWKKLGVEPSRFFDSNFYLGIYEDVRLKGTNPLLHYILHGWSEGRAPSPLFDRAGFLAAHPNIDPTKSDPAACCLMLYGGYQWNTNTLSSGAAAYSVTALMEEMEPEVEAKCQEYFDSSFYLSMYPDVGRASANPYWHYMNFGHHENRNPSATFDTFFYKKTYLSESPQANPLVHFVSTIGEGDRRVRPESSLVLSPVVSRSGQAPSICVHVHCYYPEQLGEVCKGILNFPTGVHVVFTVCSEADRVFTANYVARYLDGIEVDVVVVPNRGRDIAPFLVGSASIWRKFDLVLHIHTKNSGHITWGVLWRRYLFDQLIGSKEVVNAVVEKFTVDAKLGALYPENYYEIKKFTLSNPNIENVDNTLQFLGLDASQAKMDDFAAGSMCWFRSKALVQLLESIKSVDLFELEEGQVDNTFAHALERVIPVAVKSAGFDVKSYSTPVRISLGTPLPAPVRDQSGTTAADKWPRDTPRAALRPVLPLGPKSNVFNGIALDIHWVIPSFGKGAGGHMTIFRIVRFLEQFGHHQTLWLQGATNMPSEESARQRISDWYLPIGPRVNVLFLPDDVRQLSGDVLIATDCWTAFPVSQATSFKERFYFVQDYEPDFHAAGANQLVAESTYNFGFSALCAGAWLDNIMKSKGMWSRRWDLSVDHDIYFPASRLPSSGTNQRREIQIAFYARPYTPRRAVELGFAALEQLHASGTRFKVHLFGEENVDVTYNFPYEQHGILNHDQLAELYRSSDLGLVFSATNYSLIPLEMMACGLPVIELDVPSTRAIFQNGEVKFALPTPYDIASAVVDLIDNPEKIDAQVERGLEFIRGVSWEQSARKVEAALKERLGELGFTDVSEKLLESPVIIEKPRVSVFIPTHNAGSSFKDVLSALSHQKCDFKFDVLVIDSESTDNTLEIVEQFRHKNVRFSQIPKAEFQHGRTRNLGISMTEGDHVAILTQDALPVNDTWLASLIHGFSFGPKIAGVTGRHEAYPQHGAFVARDIKAHFDNLALLPRVIDSNLGLPSFYYPGSIAWRMLAYFYSDNNSAMSRAVWKHLPYPEIEWGEDYVWASLALKAGFQKGYVDDAVVYHSHDFPGAVLLKTAITEGKFWAQEFGICLYNDAKAAITQANERDRSFAREKGISMSALKQRLKANELLIKGRVQGWAENIP